MCKTSLKTKGIIVTIVGVALVAVITPVGWIAYPDIVNHLIATENVLVEGKLTWTLWQKPRFPVRMNHYIFHWKNPQDVLQRGVKPEVEQRGPYVFDEYREKNISGKVTGKVMYRENRVYIFNATASWPYKADDYIVTVNPIYAAVAKLLDIPNNPLSGIANKIADVYLKSKQEFVYMNHTAEDILYKGWIVEPYIDVINLIINQTGLDIKPIPIDTRFGLFSARNDTDDGEFAVNTGVLDKTQLAHIESWNNKSFLNYWQGPDSYCNQIAGTDGTVFPAQLEKDQLLYIYHTDLCRTIYGEYSEESNHAGIPANRYVVPEKVLGSKEEQPENWCFCQTNDTCYGSGILDLSACYGGVPVLGSNPHFYGADQKYINGVTGVEPDRAKHLTYFDIERLTSVLLYAAKRVQVNVELKKYMLPALANVTYVILPLLWYEETAEADDETAALVRTYLVDTLQAVDITRGVLLGVAVVMAVTGIVLIALGRKKARRVV